MSQGPEQGLERGKQYAEASKAGERVFQGAMVSRALGKGSGK